MERIVTKPIKIDLHIHSCFSSLKDGEKVKNNTIENLPILYRKLAEESINMISITDHNNFNYDLYRKINNDIVNESIDTGDMINCLPGIEFDVELRGKKVHVIAIFDDGDDLKLQAITKVLLENPFNNQDKNAFTEFKFKEILTKIDLSVSLIAHQKSDVRAKIHNDNLSRIGEKEFDNLISVDYFDAVEFRSGKVEGMLANYKFEHDLENLRYITGTDCHDWSVYPKQDMTCKNEIKFTFIRSLCSFKGLAMALTEASRIQIGYYGIRQPFVTSLPITINGKNNDVELSSGINVIIGDNSIGKSLFLEKFFNEKYSASNKEVIRSHARYLTSKKIILGTIEGLDDLSLLFRSQGGIRSDFQKDVNLKDIDFFKDKFSGIDNSEAKRLINFYVNNVWDLIKNNQERINKKKDLNYRLNIPAESEDRHYFLKLTSKLEINRTDYQPIINSFNSILQEIHTIEENKLFTHNEELERIKSQVNLLHSLYNQLKIDVELKNKIINIISTYTEEFNNKYIAQQAQQEKNIQTFRLNMIESHKRILEAVNTLAKPILDPVKDFKPIKLNESINIIGKYKFISKNSVELIDIDELTRILLFPFKDSNTLQSLNSIQEDNIEQRFKKTQVDKFNQQQLTNEKLYSSIIDRYCEENIFKKIYLINKNDTQLVTGNSPGRNALIFLDVLSYDPMHQLVVIDQPGDDVSQNRVASDLVDILKRMSSRGKQIILVTHKAELVVNLDVDNVIVLKEDEKGDISVEYGALEYEGKGINGTTVNILNDVANILDGGVETIRRRWKRYDKKNN